MKKILSIMLILATLLSLASCQGLEEASSETATTTTPAVSSGDTETAPPLNLPTVPDPLTWDDINALPIANNSMSEMERRQLVLDFFRMQQTFRWTPNEDLKYIITSYGTENNFPVGNICEGLPYQGGKGNLYIAMYYYDEQTGVLDVAKVGGRNMAEIIGNHCSSGTYWAWSRVSDTYDGDLTVTIVAKNGAVPVGPYTYDTSIDKWTGDYSTRKVCQTNGEQVMFQSYANMKIADGMVFCNSNGGGHVQMVSAAPVVVRKNGKIDGDESYLLYMDQGSAQNKIELPDGTIIHRQGEVDVKLTFSQMYKTGYVPFTIDEFRGGTIEPATLTLSNAGEISTLDDLTSGNVTCNYAMSHAIVSIYKPDGSLVRNFINLVSNTFGAKEEKMSQFVNKAVVRHYLAGGNTIEVVIQVGTGERIIVFDGTLAV